MPLIPGLKLENWVTHPEGRLEALQQLERYVAAQDKRDPCEVDVARLDPGVRGEHYIEGSIEHIDLDAGLLDETAPYKAVETLFHESRHSFQNHVVQHPEIAESQQQLQDCQMSKNGGYIQPEQAQVFSDYRFQPTEVDAREVARARTDALYQDTFGDKTAYPAYQAQKEQEIANDIEVAKRDYGLDPELPKTVALPLIEANARDAMISQYHFRMAEQAGNAEVPAMATAPSTNQESQLTEKQVAQTAGEVAGQAAGVPGGAEVGKMAGEAAGQAQTAANESLGQSTEEPLSQAQRAAENAPANEASQLDDQEYYGYSH